MRIDMRLSTRQSRTLITLVTLLMMSSAATARDYLIEVVLFETVAGRDLSAGGLYYPKIGRSLGLGSEEAVAQGFLPMEQALTLTENAQSIAQSGRYRLIRHLAWRQPGLDEDSAVPVRISLGKAGPVYLPDDTRPFEQFIPAFAQAGPDHNKQINAATVSGSIKVRLGRFLHLEAKLVYTDADTAQSFRLAQSRKMRSGELHYIDNPRFGLLSRISRLEDSDEPADNSDVNNTAEESAPVPAPQ